MSVKLIVRICISIVENVIFIVLYLATITFLTLYVNSDLLTLYLDKLLYHCLPEDGKLLPKYVGEIVYTDNL
jgi:hypothetical protein